MENKKAYLLKRSDSRYFSTGSPFAVVLSEELAVAAINAGKYEVVSSQEFPILDSIEQIKAEVG